MGVVMPEMSASWKESRPMRWVATWPLITTRGMESILAVAMPVTMLQTPGPLVAKQTPTFPVARA